MSQSRRIAARVSFGLATCGAALTVAYAFTDAYAPIRALRFVSASGWLAGSLLALALCVSPLQHALRRMGRSRPGWLPALRRSLGIAAASCGLFHGTYALLALPGIPGLSLSVAWLRAGLLTLGILLTLFATSFAFVIRSLRLQHWKELHRLVYAAAVALTMHLILGPFGSPRLEVSFLSLILVLLLLRVWLATVATERSSGD
jgi:sulfoxide reductase heme-binding subunit YedZ